MRRTCPAAPAARSWRRDARWPCRTLPGCAWRPGRTGSRQSPATSGTFPGAWPRATSAWGCRIGGRIAVPCADARRLRAHTVPRPRWRRQLRRSCPSLFSGGFCRSCPVNTEWFGDHLIRRFRRQRAAARCRTDRWRPAPGGSFAPRSSRSPDEWCESQQDPRMCHRVHARSASAVRRAR